MDVDEIGKRERIGGLPAFAVGGLALFTILIEGLTLWLRRVDSIERVLSGRWISLDMVGGILEIVAAVVVVLLFTNARPRDISLTSKQLGAGLAVTLAIWILSQITQMIIGLARFGYVSLFDGWRATSEMLLPIVPTLVSEVIPEELVWRGIVLIWMLDYLERKVSLKDSFFRLGSALLASSAIYALSEFPDRAIESVGRSVAAADLVALTATGLFFGLLYLRTRNLWIVIGVHFLVVWPLPLVDPWFDAARLAVLTSAILLVPRPGERITSNRSPLARRQTQLSRS